MEQLGSIFGLLSDFFDFWDFTGVEKLRFLPEAFGKFCYLVLLDVSHNQLEDFDPFSLSIDGDKLQVRGTTDCLGHVALVTELMRKLGETKTKLKSILVAVFIASEENSSIPGVGIDALVKDGVLDTAVGTSINSPKKNLKV